MSGAPAATTAVLALGVGTGGDSHGGGRRTLRAGRRAERARSPLPPRRPPERHPGPLLRAAFFGGDIFGTTFGAPFGGSTVTPEAAPGGLSVHVFPALHGRPTPR